MHIILKIQDVKYFCSTQMFVGIEAQDWPACLRDHLQGNQVQTNSRRCARKEGTDEERLELRGC